MYNTNKDATEKDIEGDENKIKQFLRDIGYEQRGDTNSNRSNLMRRMLASIGEPTSQIASTTMVLVSTCDNEIYQRDTTDYEQGK